MVRPGRRRVSAAPRVLMVGTALDGHGGVSAVVKMLRSAGLFEREGVAYVATHADGGVLAKLGGAARGFWRALWLCLRARPAIVHVHAASHASFLRKSLVLLLGRLAGAHTIFHLHGGEFRGFAQGAGPLLRRWIRHTLEASSRVIALSAAWGGFVREFAPRARVEIVPNGVPLARTDEQAPERGRILFLGRVTPAKGVDELLQAVAGLAPHHPHLRLVLAGEGDADWAWRRARELGIASRVELPGWLDDTARAHQLARAWLFCLPSHAEGLPMAMLEAMAARCPVVVSRVGGVPEALRDGIDGLLVAAHDARALAQAIGRVLDDPGLRTRLAQAARARIEMTYSTDIVCGRLAAIYQQLAGVK